MWSPAREKDRRPEALRLAELFAAAVDRLADPRPAIQVGALHTLELLGAEAPGQQAAIVDVICAYLRAPATTCDASVRRVAVGILASRLRPAGPGFWPGMTLDLRGAELADLDLSDCRIEGDLLLDQARLTGQARLRHCTVVGRLSLAGATCSDHAWLERSTFAATTFDGVTFGGDAWFGEATFGGPASFAGATFAGHAWFGGCTFRGRVSFDHAVFRRSAGFRGITTQGPVSLTGTTFLGPARVSRRGTMWSLTAPGWRVQVDPDNESVGQLAWAGAADVADVNEFTPLS